ncbi:MAG TPA: hypothetical protein VNW92_17605 [Polyangiaceae bacterium]|nr:hypothetical protein [Polyangiaceae bacterium]
MSSSPTLPPPPGSQRLERSSTPQPSLPSLTAQSDVRVQAAIAASARAEASLSSVVRAIQHLGTGVGGAREANELLTHELEALRDMLGAANEQQLAFKQKVQSLEQALDRARQDAKRECEFLIEQHDSFIVDLMDEQEGELERRDRDLSVLRGRLAEIERRGTVETLPPPTIDTRGSARMKVAPIVSDEGRELARAERDELERTAQKLTEDRERARETVQRLQAQRDEAQSAVTRITQERDEALQQIYRLKSELGGPRIPLSTFPPPSDARKHDNASTKPPSGLHKNSGLELTLDHNEIDARLSRPPGIIQPHSMTPAPSAASRAPSRQPSPVPAIRSSITPPRSSPQASTLPPTPSRTPPPGELRRSLSSSPALQPLGASSRPPLKQKPDVSTRPLVGYSLNDEHVEAEQLEGVRLSKPPPSRDKR